MMPDEAPPYEDHIAPQTPSASQLAERYVIGALLKDSTVIRDVQQECTPHDFGDIRLGDIYAGIVRMVASREPVDYLTVFDHLAAWDVRGIGLDDLAGWQAAVPTASSAPYYGRLIREEAIRRHLRVIGGRLQEATTDPARVVSETIDALRHVRDHDTTGSGHVVSLRELLDVPEEDDAYDWVVPGLLERRDRLMLTGSEGGGKALALDTPLPTPHGWTTMGAVQVGDYVLGADGKPARVIAATEVMVDRPCYRVQFSDGCSIVADAEHLWLTDDYGSRQGVTRTPAIRTTRELAASMTARDGFCLNHSVDPTKPLDLPRQDLVLDPWVLGAWLGDGHTAGARITIGDEDRDEMLTNLALAGWAANAQSGKYLYGIRMLSPLLRQLGVLGRKHIPPEYLRASFDQRLALLQGLMDTDGTIDAKAGVGRGSGSPRCEFSVVDEVLARDVHELILSLGIVATFRADPAKLNGRVVGTRYRIAFRTELPVFRLTRKANKLGPLRTQRSRRRFITDVREVESVPVRCIQVDNADHLYLAGMSMIPTHNSTLLRQVAILAASGIHPFRFSPIDPIRVVIVDVENSERQWRRAVRRMTDECVMRGQRDPRDSVVLHCPERQIDITRPKDIGAIHRLLDEYRPDLVLVGPLYRLVPKSINNDDDATPVLAALEGLRDHGVAMLIEAHAGHATSAGGDRDMRPRGSSALLGWPEFGLGLRPGKEVKAGGRKHFQLVPWRGAREWGRTWPKEMARGQVWPWEPVVSI